MLFSIWSDTELVGAAGSELGAAIVAGADLDGDGVDDVAIGAPGEDRPSLPMRP